MCEELVKRLRNRRICIQQSGSLDDFPLLKEAADAIEDLNKLVENSNKAYRAVYQNLAVRIPRWISVEERLPEGRMEVLVCSGIFSPFIEVAFYDGLWYSAWDGKTEVSAVTHWMPLPEPPKEEEQE